MVIIDQRPSVRQWEQSINNVLVLKHYLRAVPAVYEALSGAASELLLSIRQVNSSSISGTRANWTVLRS
jgi:DNA mismatch repair protein MSH4